MWRQIDWQMVSFIAVSITQEQWFHSWHIPKIYYYDVKNNKV